MAKINVSALREEMMDDLNRYNIHLLREQGAKLGIKSVTTHNKERLVELIIEKKLKNYKSHELDFVPESTTDISDADKERLMSLHLGRMNEESLLVTGVLELREGIDGFLRVNKAAQTNEDIYISQALINKYQLKYGDRIIGKAVKIETNEWLGLVTVTAVNGNKPQGLERRDFLAYKPVPPSQRVAPKEDSSELFKMIDGAAPLYKGQRNLVFAGVPTNFFSLVTETYETLEGAKIDPIILSLSEKPENIAAFAERFEDKVVALPMDATSDECERVSHLVIESLKRTAELGKDVALIVTNMTDLIAARPRTVLEKEFTYKTLFAAARQLEASGSLTIIGFAHILGSLGETLYETLAPLANSLVVLDTTDSSDSKSLTIAESHSDCINE